MTTQPPPGWFPDPQGTPNERYWNGMDWTADVRGGAPAPAPTSGYPAAHSSAPHGQRSGGLGGQRIVALVGAALLGLGTLLPWASQGSFSGNAFEKLLPWVLTGVDDNSLADDTFIAHGFVFIGLAVAIAVAAVAMFGGRRRSALVSAGLLAGALGGADFANFTTRLSDANEGLSSGDPKATIGLGMYVALGGAVVTLASAFFKSEPRRVTESGAPTTTSARGGGQAVAHHQQPPPSHGQSSPPVQQHPSPQPAPQQPMPPRTPTPPPAEPGSGGQWWND